MKTIIHLLLFPALVACFGPSVCCARDDKGPPDKINLRILYAGHPGSDREKDFVDFLSQYFKEVRTGDLKAFKEKQTDGFEVTILDYDGDGFGSPRPRISNKYTRPTVTVGVVGAFICGGLSLKPGYL